MSIAMNNKVFVYTGGNQIVPKNVERVEIHPSVQIIQKEAFANCFNLQQVDFCRDEEFEGVQVIGEAAFKRCIRLECVVIESSVKIIRKSAFEQCISLKMVDFGPSGLNQYSTRKGQVQEIGEAAFRCTSLELVRLAPTTKIIHKGAFQKCTKLRYLVLNRGVEVIGQAAFEGCERLEWAQLSANLRHIQSRAFSNCSRLEDVLDTFSCKCCVQVGDDAFEFCTSLRNNPFASSLKASAQPNALHSPPSKRPRTEPRLTTRIDEIVPSVQENPVEYVGATNNNSIILKRARRK